MKIKASLCMVIVNVLFYISDASLVDNLDDTIAARDYYQHQRRPQKPFSIKRFKPYDTHHGYSIDINIESFKSKRFCYGNEVCKNRYKQYFECLCPKYTLCMGNGALFEAKCSTNIMPYVWIQNVNPAISKL